ncbi:MAG: DsrE/DsrF/DrsH-like family protein [Nitrososphaerota archaeon]|nr:DsrE/DsrF/DrsH-like family protein [Nitrososphaerota archaeon]MDG7041912.1 DsrE/DsrF/DrsH-like family protein [Nitrososphaerota archaeon]MDG7047001.1 DsrE/DsrF/DrsH-like family protein [Nitrososphaerota archaeon]
MNMAKRMSIVLFSGTIDKLMAASILATGAISMDMEVDFFVTFWGLNALKKDMVASNTRFSKDFEEMAGPMMQLFKAKNVPSWYETLKKAKTNGKVRIHACSLAADVMNVKKEDLDGIVDDIVGVGSYIDQADGAAITLFI